MPIEMSWYVQDRVILLKFIGDITVEDMQEISANYIDMVDTAEGDWLIHALHDADQMESLPRAIKDTVNNARDAFKHPRSGWTVAYNIRKPVLKLFGNMATGMLRVRYRIFNTRAEALAFLQETDQTLPELVTDQQESL